MIWVSHIYIYICIVLHSVCSQFCTYAAISSHFSHVTLFWMPSDSQVRFDWCSSSLAHGIHGEIYRKPREKIWFNLIEQYRTPSWYSMDCFEHIQTTSISAICIIYIHIYVVLCSMLICEYIRLSWIPDMFSAFNYRDKDWPPLSEAWAHGVSGFTWGDFWAESSCGSPLHQEVT